MTDFRAIVERYNVLARSFGEPVALADFNLPPGEISAAFTAMDEDYHISRFLSFSRVHGQEYSVGGSPVTHVQIAEAILSLL